MKKEYRLTSDEFVTLRFIKERFKSSVRPQSKPVNRFNLGFGIFGVPEQAKDGKYIDYETYEANLKELNYLNTWETYKRLKEKDKVEKYIAYKERRLLACVLSLVILLSFEIWRLF